jgi:hypothetical protein
LGPGEEGRDEPWDSPHHRPLLEPLPRIYAPVPGNPADGPDLTYYQVFVGKGTPFGQKGLTLEKIDAAEGGANTILVVEGRTAVPWARPADLPYAAGRPLPLLGDLYRKENFVSDRGRFLALFADGSVCCFLHDTPERLLRPLVTWNGGEEVNWKEVEPWCPGLRGEPTRGRPRGEG